MRMRHWAYYWAYDEHAALLAKGLDEDPETYDRVYGTPAYSQQTLAKIASNAELVAEDPEVYDRLVELELQAKQRKQVAKLNTVRPKWDMAALHNNMMGPAGLIPAPGPGGMK